MKYDIIWSDIITPTGTKTAMLQLGFKVGYIFVDRQQWCPACKRICAKFGFAVALPGPLGEIDFHPTQSPELIP